MARKMEKFKSSILNLKTFNEEMKKRGEDGGEIFFKKNLFFFRERGVVRED